MLLDTFFGWHKETVEKIDAAQRHYCEAEDARLRKVIEDKDRLVQAQIILTRARNDHNQLDVYQRKSPR